MKKYYSLFMVAIIAMVFIPAMMSCEKDKEAPPPQKEEPKEPLDSIKNIPPDTVRVTFFGYESDTTIYDQWQAKTVSFRYENGFFYIDAYKHQDTVANPYPHLWIFSDTVAGTSKKYNVNYNFKYIEKGYVAEPTSQKIHADWEIASHQSVAEPLGSLGIFSFDPVKLVVGVYFSGIMLNQRKYFATPREIEVRSIEGAVVNFKLTK